jgi:hypothetical protein
VPHDKPDERMIIESLSAKIDAVLDASTATSGLKTIIAIMTAARYARRTSMPPTVAASMLSTYIARGDPF